MSKNKSVEAKSAETPMPERDPVSPFAHAMVSLFHGPFDGVRFPDVDRTVLDESVDTLLRAQLELEASERALEEARASVRDATAVLAQNASRALAYARVFATGQPALEELLSTSPVLASASALGTARETLEAKPEEKKRRGRPRKADPTGELLPMATSEEPATDDVSVAAA